MRVLEEYNKLFRKATSLHHQLREEVKACIWDEDLVEEIIQTVLELEEEIRYCMTNG